MNQGNLPESLGRLLLGELARSSNDEDRTVCNLCRLFLSLLAKAELHRGERHGNILQLQHQDALSPAAEMRGKERRVKRFRPGIFRQVATPNSGTPPAGTLLDSEPRLKKTGGTSSRKSIAEEN